MATLVEWLDEGLTGISDIARDVLVLQIHGAPVDADSSAGAIREKQRLVLSSLRSPNDAGRSAQFWTTGP